MIEPAARKIADAGLTFIYHNHNFEFARFDGKTGLQILMESTDPAWMQFEIDTYWVQMGGGDPIDWIRRMAGRMDVVHFKDMTTDPAERKPIMAEVGEGNLNWQGIIAACAQIGVKWHTSSRTSASAIRSRVWRSASGTCTLGSAVKSA